MNLPIQGQPPHWLDTAAHSRWLEAETDRLFEFARAAASPTGGFGWLGNNGVRDDEVPKQLWINARMTHVFALATLMGRPGAAPLVDHGIAALRESFHDAEHGGWFTSISPGGPVDDRKAGYPTYFVVLGAASAVIAGRPGASDLLAEALAVTDQHFWSDAEGMSRESWDRAFSVCEPYRGGNVNMHAVEAYLTAASATGNRTWLDKALSITDRMVHRFARGNSYRVFEHFDEQWKPLPDYSIDAPAHRFRPYGSTPGHWMEWSRLILHLRAEFQALGEEPPDWMLEDAIGLFDAALRDGWRSDGGEGFVYTVDWSGSPVVRKRIRWVVAEAIGAAATLYAATGDPRYEACYRDFWDYARTYLIDYENGSWWQELDADNRVSGEVWDGKPDVYHLMHALLVPRLPLRPAMAAALAGGQLDAARR
jgi:sulfoquinovose isomerase